MLYGEAPGPRGADRSGIPFWGDRAGLAVYRALAGAGLARVPPEAWEAWDGARLKALGLRPVLSGVGLGNAYPVCPTRDGQRFRAPTRAELQGPENLDRLRRELAEAASRCPGRLRVLALGGAARSVLAGLEPEMGFELLLLPHPSAQGLLQAAPGKGKGMKLADLQVLWERNLQVLLA